MHMPLSRRIEKRHVLYPGQQYGPERNRYSRKKGGAQKEGAKSVRPERRALIGRLLIDGIGHIDLA